MKPWCPFAALSLIVVLSAVFFGCYMICWRVSYFETSRQGSGMNLDLQSLQRLSDASFTHRHEYPMPSPHAAVHDTTLSLHVLGARCSCVASIPKDPST